MSNINTRLYLEDFMPIMFITAVVVCMVLGVIVHKQFQEPIVVERIVEKIVEVEKQPDVSLNYDGLRCSTLQRQPELHYRTDRQTVTFLVECSPDVLFHFLPAEEAENKSQSN